MTPSIFRRGQDDTNLCRAAACVLLLVLVTGGANLAGAADTQSKTTSAFADTTKPVMFLKEMLVTGSRYPRAYYESPQALSFISKTALREAAPTTIGDVLSTIPGSDESKDSPWEQRSVLRGLGGQRVLVLMDGVPMNSARGNGPHPGLIAPEQIEKVEVVRGPSSVAYGSDALGGVINIITRDNRVTDAVPGVKGTAQIGGSSVDGQLNGMLELRPHVDKFSAVLSAGGRKADDFSTPSGKVDGSSFEDFNVLANLRYDASDRTVFKLGYQMYRGTDIGIPGLSSPTQNYGPGNFTTFSFPQYDRDLGQFSLERKYAHTWIASSSVKIYTQREKRNFYSQEFIDAGAYPIYGIPANGSVSRETDQDRFFDLDTWGGQIQMTSKKTERYQFTMGLDAVLDQTSGDNHRERFYHYDTPAGDSTGAVSTRISQSVPNGDFDNGAVYFQNDWFLSPQWKLSIGARYTLYHYRTEAGLALPASGPSPPVYFEALQVDNGAACGSFGLVYHPVEDLHLSFNVANGYRQPNAQDLFFNGPASVGNVLGNPDLSPEKSISYDTGVRWGRGTLGLSGNLFYSTYDDLIDAIDVTPAGNPPGAPRTYQYENISKARIWGGEAEGNWRFRRQWEARTQLSGVIGDVTSESAIETLYGLDQSQVPLNNIAPFRGTAALRWSTPDGRCWVEPALRYSWRYDRLPPPVAGVSQIGAQKKEWLVGDVSVGYKTLWGQRLVAGVRNVGDATYRPALSSLDEPGIGVFGTLSTEF